MAYHLKARETVAHGVRRIAEDQARRAADALTNEQVSSAERIHDARKRFKKIRGLLRLVRPALGKTYSRENAWFRDAGKELSRIRDADAMSQTVRRLQQHFAGPVHASLFATTRLRLQARRDRIADEETDLDEQIAELACQLNDAAKRIEDWSLDEDGFAAVAGGLKRTYKRAGDAMGEASDEPTPEAFHEWRKRVKYHWYHLRLLRDLWPAAMSALRKEAHRLADLLGDDHDLVVLAQWLEGQEDAALAAEQRRVLLGLIERRHEELRSAALDLGRRMFSEKPKHHVARMAGCWAAWRGD